MTTDRFNPPDPDELEVSVFGPSKGECIVIHVPNGPWFIVDSFRALNGSRKEPVAVAYLRDVIKTTDVYGLFLTHWHDDHTAGAGDVIRAFASSLKMVGLPDGYGKRELASLMADRLPDSLRSSMIVDIVDVTSALREPASQNIERRTLIAGSVVSPRQGSAWTLEALSPSMDDQADHFATILKFLPSYSGTVPESYDVNSGCAVLHLSVSGMSVMLSSDLDIGSDDDRGWRCIVKHRGGAIASSIVKVGHHGSTTAHHMPAWHAMNAKGKSHAAVTPFPARGGSLPREEMLAEIRKHVMSLHVSGKPHSLPARVGKILSKHSPFESYALTTPRPLDGLGQVRFRMRDGDSSPRVTVFQPAWEVIR